MNRAIKCRKNDSNARPVHRVSARVKRRARACPVRVGHVWVILRYTHTSRSPLPRRPHRETAININALSLSPRVRPALITRDRSFRLGGTRGTGSTARPAWRNKGPLNYSWYSRTCRPTSHFRSSTARLEEGIRWEDGGEERGSEGFQALDIPLTTINIILMRYRAKRIRRLIARGKRERERERNSVIRSPKLTSPIVR